MIVMRKLFFLFVLITYIFAANNAFGRSGIVSRFSSGPMTYKLNTPGIPVEFIHPVSNEVVKTRSNPNAYKAEPIAVGLGLTYFKNKSYVDFSVQGTTDADTRMKASTPGLPTSYEEDFSGNRFDYSLAAGYVFNRNYTAYVGFKVGRTKANGSKNSVASFEVEGAFIGNNLAWNISRKQALVFKVAVAQLHGEIDYDIEVTDASVLKAFTTTIGFSYGLNWRYRITDDWGLVFALTHYRYIFDDIVDRIQGSYSGEVEEKMFNSTLSLSYNFGL